MSRVIAILIVLVGLCSCGGGGGGSPSTGGGPAPAPAPAPDPWTKGVFMPSSTFAAKCANPRSGTDPFNHNMPYPDVAGSSTDENNWLRSWTNELYLWYSEVPDVDPASYTTAAYFPLLKTSGTDPAGQPKDKFHFTDLTSAFEQLAQAGVSVGYGLQFAVLQSSPPRNVVVAFTQANSPATAANLARGAAVLSVDGVDINATDPAGVATLNAGLSPSKQGDTHTFSIQDLGAASARTVSLTAAAVQDTPVLKVAAIPSNGGVVGYILFNDQFAAGEQELIDAVNNLKSQSITDLVLDLRYNGGGYLAIAAELAYMIAGPGPTAGRTFERLEFNSKNPSTDPVTGQPLTPTPFLTTTQGFSTTSAQALPTLNLTRVFVLTGPDTCSASESIMNGLRGVNVQVIQIGSTTCGKPYGFYPQDNCGTTYFSIEFQGVNDQNFGAYPDGFSPQNTQSSAGVLLPGCSVADDFSHALGDPNESLLNVALSYGLTSTCSVPPSGFARTVVKRSFAPGEGLVIRPAVKEIRILRRPGS